MFALSSHQKYLLYDQPADMRKSFDALCGLVRETMGRDPLSGEVFIFLNRQRTHLKLLHWEFGGLVLYYKRLESGTFTPPFRQGLSPQISYAELVLMTEGMMAEKLTQKTRWNIDKSQECFG